MSCISILSLRDLVKIPAMGCIVELEEVLASTLEAEILVVCSDGSLSRQGFPQQSYPSTDRLFISTVSFFDLQIVLAKLKPRVRNGRAIYAYVFDAFGLRSRWPRGLTFLSRYLAPLRQVTHYFTPIRSCVAEMQDLLGRPVSFVPLGVDSVRFHSIRAHRFIDVNAYGRQPQQLVNHLADYWNRPNSSRFLHFTAHVQLGVVHDLERHRAHFWSLLERSTIALAYDPLVCNPGGRFPTSFVSQRWFESFAAGCLVAGSRPQCLEADELLDWDDATIELPLRVEDAAHALEELLKDDVRIRRIRQQNVYKSLSRHDWRHRIGEMLRIVEVSAPKSLIGALAEAHSAAEKVGSFPLPQSASDETA